MGLRRKRATRAGRARLKGDARASSFVGSNLALRFPQKAKIFNFCAVRVFGPRSLRRQTRSTREWRGRRGLWVDIAFGFDRPGRLSTRQERLNRGRGRREPTACVEPARAQHVLRSFAHRRVIFLRRTITLYLRSPTEPPWGTRRSRRWETSSCSFLS